jgi:hypothetical protein
MTKAEIVERRIGSFEIQPPFFELAEVCEQTSK